jgi:hypothetical protein
VFLHPKATILVHINKGPKILNFRGKAKSLNIVTTGDMQCIHCNPVYLHHSPSVHLTGLRPCEAVIAHRLEGSAVRWGQNLASSVYCSVCVRCLNNNNNNNNNNNFSFILCVQTGSGAHPASCTMGTGGPSLGGKAQPGRDADHSPPSSAEVVNE